MKSYKLNAAVFFLLFTIPATSVTCLASKTGSIPSCHDTIAAINTKPGTSPECAPVILKPEKATEFLKEFSVKKIKNKWYIFLSDKTLADTFDHAARWRSLSLLISSVQSLYLEKADCYIARLPKTDKEKKELLAGEYPQELIAAYGQYIPGEQDGEKKKNWLEYHHHLLYKLTVY